MSPSLVRPQFSDACFIQSLSHFEIASNLKSKDNVLGQYYDCSVYIDPSESESKSKTYFLQFHCDLFAWHYGWVSSRHKTHEKHAFQVLALCKREHEDVYDVIAHAISPEFGLLCYRRKKKNEENSAPSEYARKGFESPMSTHASISSGNVTCSSRHDISSASRVGMGSWTVRDDSLVVKLSEILKGDASKVEIIPSNDNNSFMRSFRMDNEHDNYNGNGDDRESTKTALCGVAAERNMRFPHYATPTGYPKRSSETFFTLQENAFIKASPLHGVSTTKIFLHSDEMNRILMDAKYRISIYRQCVSQLKSVKTLRLSHEIFGVII